MQPVYNDIALYQLFGRRGYLRFGPVSLYLLKFHRVHVRLRKRPSIEFFLFKFQIFIVLWAEGNWSIDAGIRRILLALSLAKDCEIVMLLS